MKRRNIIILLTLLMSMMGIEATAHDIAVANSDGKIIYYSWTNNGTELSVSYRGSSNTLIIDGYSGSVVIPETVTYNGTAYPVTSIGDRAFSSCSSLTNVTIPNSVTSIGESAFSNCIRLTSVTIPNSVTSIGGNAFAQTTWYNNQPVGLVYAGKVAYKYKGTMPSNTNIILKEGTLGIASSAFYGCDSLTSVNIPNSVTAIGNYAFFGCSGLTSVIIPNSVTSIGSPAFSGCSGLTSIIVESGNTVYDSRNNCNAIITIETNELIASCKNTTIPNSVTSIGDSAFYQCSGLTSVTIPNSVTSIGSQAFYGCYDLTSVTIGNSVTSIGSRAFSDCSGLTSIKVESGNTVYDSRNNCNAIITTETNQLIVGCKNTTIPNSVTSIGYDAFSGCRGMTSVTIPNSVTSIGEWAFQNCSGLTSITIPNSVKSIGQSAFSNCYSLTSVTIPNSVTSIGRLAFFYCSGLTSIIVDEGNINYDSRENCHAIIETNTNTLVAGCKTTVILNSVTSIGDDAFFGCSGLTSVTIPNSVTSIGGNAFACCI